MRYLILSDIHSNDEALAAVLARVRRKRFDRVVVLGDFVGYGANPNQVIDRIRNIKKPKRMIRGNHDKVVCGVESGDLFNPVALRPPVGRPRSSRPQPKVPRGAAPRPGDRGRRVRDLPRLAARRGRLHLHRLRRLPELSRDRGLGLFLRPQPHSVRLHARAARHPRRAHRGGPPPLRPREGPALPDQSGLDRPAARPQRRRGLRASTTPTRASCTSTGCRTRPTRRATRFSRRDFRTSSATDCSWALEGPGMRPASSGRRSLCWHRRPVRIDARAGRRPAPRPGRRPRRRRRRPRRRSRRERCRRWSRRSSRPRTGERTTNRRCAPRPHRRIRPSGPAPRSLSGASATSARRSRSRRCFETGTPPSARRPRSRRGSSATRRSPPRSCRCSETPTRAVAARAAWAVGMLGGPSGEAALVAAVAKANEPGRRAALLRGLWRFGCLLRRHRRGAVCPGFRCAGPRGRALRARAEAGGSRRSSS